ncbi:MarR family transcriptional regulator [Chitinophaga sancti]|uniref:MarR family winged helix-turn-helix transcriptional regulator n=1 Tax=Chitinophaga sancti TaxID=1004 RepID=UPI002A75D130|nr:MarR family transcriptional regulator [Chitinophaga sancti]WPQ61624.1 MarR family transcriptional regulator [Chitinophaga sancti]
MPFVLVSPMCVSTLKGWVGVLFLMYVPFVLVFIKTSKSENEPGGCSALTKSNIFAEHMSSQTTAEKAKELLRSMGEVRNTLRQYISVRIREEEMDITFELLEILAYLNKKDGINQQEIADIMLKDKSSMTYQIDGLVKRDLVKRMEDENDRRNKLIFLTEKGKDLQQTMQGWVAGLYDKSMEGIDAGTIDMALAMVQKMHTNLNRK